MYTIEIRPNSVVFENDGQDMQVFQDDFKIDLYGVTYNIARWGFGFSCDGTVLVPLQRYLEYYQSFKKRMGYVYYLTKLFEHYKVPYRLEYPSVCSFTNLKGQIYACYL